MRRDLKKNGKKDENEYKIYNLFGLENLFVELYIDT